MGLVVTSATVNATGCGFDSHSRKGNISLVARHSATLRYATQYAVPPELGEKWRTKVFYSEQSVLTLGSRVPSAYPGMCGTQCEAKIYVFKIIGFVFYKTTYLPREHITGDNTERPPVHRVTVRLSLQYFRS